MGHYVLVPAKSLRTPQNVINVACISNLVKSIQAFGKCKSHIFLASANFEKKKSNYFWLTINGTFSGSVRRLLTGTSTMVDFLWSLKFQIWLQNLNIIKLQLSTRNFQTIDHSATFAIVPSNYIRQYLHLNIWTTLNGRL